MRMTRLNQFFRDVGSAVTRSPEVKTAVSQASRQVEKQVAKEVARGLQRFTDRFEPAKPKPPPTASAADADYVKGLYRDLLGREPDADGLRAHLAGIAGGMSREDIRQVFLTSAEYREKQAAPTEPTPPPPPAPPVTPPPPVMVEPGAPLSTVRLRPEYAGANIDKSSASSAALSAARWAKEKYPELFARADDRQVCYEIMTHVIGALRVAGYDATRVVNHADRPMGDGWRYGSDAIVLNGEVFDVYRGIGEANEPQAMNAGPYAAGRLRE